jgi:hypothetical protein
MEVKKYEVAVKEFFFVAKYIDFKLTQEFWEDDQDSVDNYQVMFRDKYVSILRVNYNSPVRLENNFGYNEI